MDESTLERLSTRTVENYEDSLSKINEFMQTHRVGSLHDLTSETALQFLEMRSHEVSQKTLDNYRNAIHYFFKYRQNGNKAPQRVEKVKSKKTRNTSKGGAYTSEQVRIICEAQSFPNRLATELAYASGLRAHELLTIEKASGPFGNVNSQHPCWHGREGEKYIVSGTGKALREVIIPSHLGALLELERLDQPTKVIDRGVTYIQHYQIGGGCSWSQSFSKASIRVLNWSRGANGLRYSFAQERIEELRKSGLRLADALACVAIEMGNTSPESIRKYLC